MKKFKFFVAALAVCVFASCGGNKKPAPEPEVVIEVNSETDFTAQLTTDQITVAKPYFNVEKWSGQITVDGKSGVATVTSGTKTVKISPPAGFTLIKVYSKADAVRVEGKIKVKKGTKEVEKAVGYWIFADSARKKGAQVKNGAIQDFNTTEVAVVSLKPVPGKAEKTVFKKDLTGSEKVLRDVPSPATK